MFSQASVSHSVHEGGGSVWETPKHGNVRVVRILLECILATVRNLLVTISRYQHVNL